MNPEELWGRFMRMEEELVMVKKELRHLKGEAEGPVVPSHVEVEVLHK
jgi:hypothetical protein